MRKEQSEKRSQKPRRDNGTGSLTRRADGRYQASLPDISFHNLRHSTASLLLSMGVPPRVVQEILGHSSIRMTMDIYRHVMPGQQADAARKMDAVFLLGSQEEKEAR